MLEALVGFRFFLWVVLPFDVTFPARAFLFDHKVRIVSGIFDGRLC